jgi:exodeoxyribonuclease V alpha subunit
VLNYHPSVVLTFNFRSQDEIVSNAIRILNGKLPIRNSRFEIIYVDDPFRALIELVDAPFMKDDHQIIAPMRKGPKGTLRMNTSIQMKLNPRGEALELDRFDPKEPDVTVRALDKFLWIKNDYNVGLFNGEIGAVDWVSSEDGTIGLTTPDRSLTVPPYVKMYSRFHGHVISYDPRKQLELGYAVTTHKAQGSEFDTVVYILSRNHAFLLDRNNFYTGVTRAKKRVILLADTKGMSLSMRKR